VNRPARIVVSAIFLCLSITTLTSFAFETYSVASTEVVLFRDGVAEVRQILNVNETLVSISLPLLSSSVTSVLVLDQNMAPLSYEIVSQNISVVTLGATQVTLEYATSDLTKKEGRVWTFVVSMPYEAKVTLPEQAEVIYLSDLPSSIVAIENRTVLALTPGLWEVGYVLQLTPSWTPPPTASPSPTSTPPPTNPLSGAGLATGYVALAAAGAAIILFGLLLVRRRGIDASSSELRPEDKEVLRYLATRGGKVLESELRQKLLLPRTSAWRQVRRLERMGYVRVVKEGTQNAIELVRRGWKPFP